MVDGGKGVSSSESSDATRRWSRAMGLGVDLAAGMVLFTMGGYWLDQRRDTGTFWTLMGMFMGLVYGGYEVWKVVRTVPDADDKKPEAGGRP